MGKKSSIYRWQPKKERIKTPEGQLSRNSRMKLKNAIRWLVASADTKQTYEKKLHRKVDWKINMCTLTFHENFQDDNKAREILSRWLEMAQYRFKIPSYVWKAEPQERGAIHFHLSTSVYMQHSQVKYTWNRELKKHGLSEVKDNSTDVHAVANVQSHENYLAEYFLNEDKHEGRRTIKGRLWGCSHNLSQAGKEYLIIDEHELRSIQSDIEHLSLYRKLQNENKPIPEFLKFTDVYLVDGQYYKDLPECELKQLYRYDIQKLKGNQHINEFWKS
jgi:hypothetical protein